MVHITTKNKPETVVQSGNNKIKCGVDITDQMARQYTVKAGTRRWPVAVFYNILDLVCINAQCLYVVQEESCRCYLQNKFDVLARRRTERSSCLRKDSSTIAAVLPPLFNYSYQNSIVNKSRKRKQCQINVNCEQNKTTKFYCGCRRSVCGRYTGCVKVECVDCTQRCSFLCFCMLLNSRLWSM